VEILPQLQKLIKKVAHIKKVSETVVLEILWDKTQQEFNTQLPLKTLPVFQPYSYSKRGNGRFQRETRKSIKS